MKELLNIYSTLIQIRHSLYKYEHDEVIACISNAIKIIDKMINKLPQPELF